MSKIGKKPITIPANVQIEIGPKVVVKGPLGELTLKIPSGIKVVQKENSLLVTPTNEERQTRAFHGLIRSLLANMVEGVANGFKKQLELTGIGYRVNLEGENLVLSVGYSHPVKINPLEGIKFSVAENKITVSGIDKELVGRVSAEIRAVRPPDAYKGKGVRYSGETVKLKAGKAAKAGAGATGG